MRPVSLGIIRRYLLKIGVLTDNQYRLQCAFIHLFCDSIRCSWNTAITCLDCASHSFLLKLGTVISASCINSHINSACTCNLSSVRHVATTTTFSVVSINFSSSVRSIKGRGENGSE